MTTSILPEAPTADPAARFLEELERRPHEPLLRKVSKRVSS